MVLSRLDVRTFREEDLAQTVALAHSNPNGCLCFARDELFLRYFIDYPGVSTDSVFVAIENENIVGLAIVAITGEENLRQGDIIELQANDTLSAESLVRAAEDYCAAKDVYMIAVAPPPHIDRRKVFADWQRFETNVMMCKPLSVLSQEKFKSEA